jgi:hypothetical protein
MLTALAALVGVQLPATPAHAAGGVIRHYAPDDGFDDPFLVRWNGFDSWIAEGDAKAGVTMIYVPAGEQIVCTTNGVNWFIMWDSTGWHGVGNGSGQTCVNQLD